VHVQEQYSGVEVFTRAWQPLLGSENLTGNSRINDSGAS